MDMPETAWGVVIVGGPVLFGVILLWVLFNNRQTRAERRRTEEATRRLYEEEDASDKARGAPAEHAPVPRPRPAPEPAVADNLSAHHQAPGDARRPSDTLDRPSGAVPPSEWSPGSDEGKSRPTAPGGSES